MLNIYLDQNKWIDLARAGVKIEQGTQLTGGDVASVSAALESREHLLEAARLFGVAESLREQDGLALPADVMYTYDRDVTLLRERLGEGASGEAWSEGRSMSFEQAVEYALAITAPAEPAASAGPSPLTTAGTPGPAPHGDPEVERLTLREREVVALIIQGRTNREIAEVLVLSERTVDSHVRNVMGKLDVNSRAQIAAWAVQHGVGGPR